MSAVGVMLSQYCTAQRYLRLQSENIHSLTLIKLLVPKRILIYIMKQCSIIIDV